MIEVSVLAGPQINWAGYIDFIKEKAEKSPTRNLDQHSMDLQSPISFAASLQSLRSPKHNPWRDKIDYDLLNHVTFTFGVYASYDVIANVALYECFLRKSQIELDRSTGILIITGTILEWYLTLPVMLDKGSNKDCQKVFRKIYVILRNTDLKNLLAGINLE